MTIAQPSAAVRHLIDELKANGINNANVLKAIASVPRENFVAEALAHQAWDNTALPIGQGQTISQPYIVARMTESLLMQSKSNKVLEIGTGSGYQTAILSHLFDEVCTLERIQALQFQAKRRLRNLDRHNISYKYSDGWEGWASRGPYDAIIATAAAATLPPSLISQLADGGILVIPIGTHTQQLMSYTRKGNACISQTLEAVRFVPMVKGELL